MWSLYACNGKIAFISIFKILQAYLLLADLQASGADRFCGVSYQKLYFESSIF